MFKALQPFVARGPIVPELRVDWVQNDQWNLAVSAFLVAGIGRIELQEQGPEATVLFWCCRSCSHPSARRADLYQRVGLRLQIEPPGWMLPGATVRGHQNQKVVDRQVEQWCRAKPTCASSPRCQQQHWHSEQRSAKASSAQSIHQDMQLGNQSL